MEKAVAVVVVVVVEEKKNRDIMNDMWIGRVRYKGAAWGGG